MTFQDVRAFQSTLRLRTMPKTKILTSTETNFKPALHNIGSHQLDYESSNRTIHIGQTDSLPLKEL